MNDPKLCLNDAPGVKHEVKVLRSRPVRAGRVRAMRCSCGASWHSIEINREILRDSLRGAAELSKLLG